MLDKGDIAKILSATKAIQDSNRKIDNAKTLKSWPIERGLLALSPKGPIGGNANL